MICERVSGSLSKKLNWCHEHAVRGGSGSRAQPGFAAALNLVYCSNITMVE
jgi:hypothetical protein